MPAKAMGLEASGSLIEETIETAEDEAPEMEPETVDNTLYKPE